MPNLFLVEQFLGNGILLKFLQLFMLLQIENHNEAFSQC